MSKWNLIKTGVRRKGVCNFTAAKYGHGAVFVYNLDIPL
jgi:hypothetical protein